MKRILFLFFTALLPILSLPVMAQKFLPKTIQFKGDPEYSDQELLAAAGLKKGVVLTSAEMNEHSKALMGTGVFDTLAFKFDGEDLVFELTPAEQMFPIRLEKLPISSGAELDEEIHRRFPLYHGKVPAVGTLLDGVKSTLEDLLAAQGIRVQVAATPYGVLGSRKVSAMSFSVVSPALRVGAISFVGVSPALQSRVNRVAEIAAKTAFDSNRAEANLEEAVSTFYVDEGYAAVKVHAARAGAVASTPEAIDIPFTISVEEGKTYKLGSFQLLPNLLFNQARFEAEISTQSELLSRESKLQLARSLLLSRFKSKGYLDCTVILHPVFNDAMGIADYVVEIVPGSIYHLGFVKFENVSDELRVRLMRFWQMLPGDPFDDRYVSNFLLQAQKDDSVLQRTLANVKVDYDVLADPVTHDVNCVIRMKRGS